MTAEALDQSVIKLVGMAELEDTETAPTEVDQTEAGVATHPDD
jgi:hypothetical protein